MSKISASQALQNLDPLFLKENDEFVVSYKNINWQQIDSINTVLVNIDKLIKRYPSPQNDIKIVIVSIFTEVLTRYPFLFGYWKKFTAVQYQLYDLKTSLETLESATNAFPQSMELWMDYLKVLTVNFPNDIKRIRSKINQAKKLIGYQFYSHVFWDLVIDFESKQSTNLIPIYDEIVGIPLHQYAKYVEPYKKLLNDTEKIKQLQLKVKNNQRVIGEVWTFESKIKQNFFNLNPLKQDEIDNWENYLTFLIQNKKSVPLTKSVFERCLVPCCFIEEFWVKYLCWLNENNTTMEIIEIYDIAIKLLPTDKVKIRMNYIDFLKTKFNDEKIKNFVFDKLTETICKFLEHWGNNIFMSSKLLKLFFPILKRQEFNSTILDSEDFVNSKQLDYSKLLSRCITNFIEQKNNEDEEALSKMLNNGNIHIAVAELIKQTWLINKNNLQTRKYFNQFSKIPEVRTSVEFWSLYYRFEKNNNNFVKLNKFINDLGNEIMLPVQIVNNIINDYETFYLLNANLSTFRNQKIRDDSIQPVVDPILLSKFKINKPKWRPGQYKKINSAEWYKSQEYKENGHPGIRIERPYVTNTIIDKPIKELMQKTPSLPAFRNLEKINQPPVYTEQAETTNIIQKQSINK